MGNRLSWKCSTCSSHQTSLRPQDGILPDGETFPPSHSLLSIYSFRDAVSCQCIEPDRCGAGVMRTEFRQQLLRLSLNSLQLSRDLLLGALRGYTVIWHSGLFRKHSTESVRISRSPLLIKGQCFKLLPLRRASHLALPLARSLSCTSSSYVPI